MINIFICPASDSLNKHNETGSIGQLSYEFLKAISTAYPESSIDSLVMHSHKVESFANVNVIPYFSKSYKRSSVSSLRFYFGSFFRFFLSTSYRKSDVVHHIMPFAPGLSFNLFFIFKRPNKKYVLGPILGPHTDLVELKDELAGSDRKIIRSIANRLLTGLSKKTIQNSDLVLFPDKYAYESFKVYLKPGQKYKFLEFGITSNVKKVTGQKIKLDKLRVMYVGRLTERKGCIYLIEALHSIRSKAVLDNLQVDILSDGPQRKFLNEKVVAYGLSNIVTFHGGFEGNNEISQFYNKADVLVLPSLSDTWMSIKEGLTCGVPVITTNIASHAEHIEEGVNGYLVEPFDSIAIAEHLGNLVKDRELLSKMSEAAIQSANKRYNWSKIGQTYKSYIDSAINE